jgi:exopolysaccharide production protein ExoQ
MYQTSMQPLKTSTRNIDICAIVPLAACVLALVVIPLLEFFLPLSKDAVTSGTARPETRILWPAMAAISVALAIQNRSRLAKLTWPPHIICLFSYLAFAGASALWALRPEISFIRFVQEVMIIISIVLPAALARNTSDIIRSLFLCFALASILNLLFVIGGTETYAVLWSPHGLYRVSIGSQGYLSSKNTLGESAAPALLLSLHEILHPGRRRVLGIIGVAIAISLVIVSGSKTAFGLALISPFLAGLTLITRNVTRISPAIILLSIPLCYILLTSVTHYNLNLLSYKLYGDPTFTGRTVIWDFVRSEVDRRPLLGWGYESFWLVPGSPAFVEAPSWVKAMPNGHNGYYDTMLDLGYVGFAFLLVFIIATLHGIGRVADRDPIRAWLVLSLALFVINYNFLERLWMHGYQVLWVVFVIAAAEIARFWQPLPLKRAASSSRSQKPGAPRPSLGAHMPLSRIGPS